MKEFNPPHFDRVRIDKDVDPNVAETFLREELDLATKEKVQSFEGLEIEPSPEEKQIIEDVIFGLRIMLKYVYKIENFKEIDCHNVHIVKAGALYDDYGRGMYSKITGHIYVETMGSFLGSKIAFASTLAHELLHALSYNEVLISQDRIRPVINGLDFNVVGPKEIRIYFDFLDEAVNAILTMRFREIEMLAGKHGEYQKEALALEKVKNWLRDLPETIGIEKEKWIGPIERAVVSIPYAEEMAGAIDDDRLSLVQKVAFYQEKIGSLPNEITNSFYFERSEDVYELNKDFRAAHPNLSDVGLSEKFNGFLSCLLRIKITGQGVKEIFREIEKDFGPGSFKRFAHKYARIIERKQS